MNNYTNIYDIDGNIIRKAGDNHKFTIEEVEKMVDDLTEKVKNNPDNDVYKVYLNNAHKWLFNMYNNMNKEDLMKRLDLVKDSINDAKTAAAEAESDKLAEINESIEQLKREYESDMDTEVESSVSEPVETLEDPKPTVMDEYVDYEEVKQ